MDIILGEESTYVLVYRGDVHDAALCDTIGDFTDLMYVLGGNDGADKWINSSVSKPAEEV